MDRETASKLDVRSVIFLGRFSRILDKRSPRRGLPVRFEASALGEHLESALHERGLAGLDLAATQDIAAFLLFFPPETVLAE